MDFGDCHKSIFAHDDSVTGLQFVPKTHYFFTCGKDGKVKEWDGDTYDKIMTLQVISLFKIKLTSNLLFINFRGMLEKLGHWRLVQMDNMSYLVVQTEF